MNDTAQFSEALAAFYEYRHDYGDIGDESFYLAAASETDGPVLEGACGTGRLYLELLRAGIDADGFDIAPAMLDILRENAEREGLDPSVWTADLRSPGADRRYELVMVPYNSFAVLETVDDQLAALDALYEVLDDGGQLLFDVYVPRYDLIADSFGEWQDPVAFEYEGQQLRGRSRATIESQVDQTYRTEQELLDSEGTVVARDEFVISHLPPQQVELLCRQSSFDDWTAEGGFDGGELTDGDGVQVWTLTK